MFNNNANLNSLISRILQRLNLKKKQQVCSFYSHSKRQMRGDGTERTGLGLAAI